MGSVGKDEFSKTLEEKAEQAGVKVRYQKQDDHPTGKVCRVSCSILSVIGGTVLVRSEVIYHTHLCCVLCLLSIFRSSVL